MRATLNWSPCWEGPTRAWALGFLNKNRWRCDRINDIDDLLQDAYLTFLKVSQRYPRVMGQAHFMTLYRTAIRNEMHDRARYMRRKREQHLDTSVDAAEINSGRIGEVANEGYITLLIEQAPEALKQALICLGENPAALHQPNGHYENLNMKLRRVLGYDPTVDLTGGLRTLLEA